MHHGGEGKADHRGPGAAAEDDDQSMLTDKGPG